MANSEGGHLGAFPKSASPDGAFLASLAREIAARGEALLQAGELREAALALREAERFLTELSRLEGDSGG